MKIVTLVNKELQTEKQIREAAKTTSFSLIGFTSKESAEEFAKQFPKFVKAEVAYEVNSKSFKQYGIEDIQIGSEETRIQFQTFKVRFPKMPINKTTGDINEAGEKRMAKIIEFLQKENYIK